jgi:hypothetical protein
MSGVRIAQNGTCGTCSKWYGHRKLLSGSLNAEVTDYGYCCGSGNEVCASDKCKSYAFSLKSNRGKYYPKIGISLEYASGKIKADKGIVLKAVKQNGNVLKYASKELKADREVVLVAVKQNGLALQYASKELIADRKIVNEAIKQNEYALQYASSEFIATLKVLPDAGS